MHEQIPLKTEDTSNSRIAIREFPTFTATKLAVTLQT